VEDVKRRIEACAPKDAQQLLLAAADTPKNGPWRPIRQATRHLIEAADGFDPKPMNPDVWIGSWLCENSSRGRSDARLIQADHQSRKNDSRKPQV
jgi:hypothetical protein